MGHWAFRRRFLDSSQGNDAVQSQGSLAATGFNSPARLDEKCDVLESSQRVAAYKMGPLRELSLSESVQRHDMFCTSLRHDGLCIGDDHYPKDIGNSPDGQRLDAGSYHPFNGGPSYVSGQIRR